MPKLTRRDFNRFRELILDCCGIRLSEKKVLLVQNRIGRRLRALGLASFREYLALFERAATRDAELPHLWTAITTNQTRFFREPHHFDIIEKAVLPGLTKKAGFVRVWSAGCATGQEVYTLAMVLDDWARRHAGFQYRVLGSDIDRQALAVAQAGVYPAEMKAEIPTSHLMRHAVVDKETFTFNAALKKVVSWTWHNFATITPLRPRVDLIFCRNAIMYLHPTTRQHLADVFHQSLLPGGALIVGSSESLHGLSLAFETERLNRTLIYRKGA